jgi:hypothetical protein
VLTFSAAAFEEFRVIAKNILLSSGLNINQTKTADLKGVTVSESMEVTTMVLQMCCGIIKVT